jgi:hypothetical protein
MLLIFALLLLTGCLGVSGPFTDDFSEPASGWGSASHETYVRGYQQGRYLIQVDVPQWFVWTTAGRNYEDAQIEVLVHPNEEVQSGYFSDDHYGVLCRFTKDQFYYFAISTDGYYAIFLRSGEGELQPLTGRAMLKSSVIHTDGSDNSLLAVCEGTLLTFFVNGEQIAQVTDDTLLKGDVGMAAGTVDQGGMIVWFDDFEVSVP